MGLTIREDDLTDEAVRALLAFHIRSLQANPGPSFALDLSGLQEPGVTVWTAWEEEALCGVGALKAMEGGGEIKSMRTHPNHLRKGVAAALLGRILREARARGYRRLSLETGDGEPFRAALALYGKHGFREGGAFADYEENGFSRFFHLDL